MTGPTPAMIRFGNVATPATAFTVSVPESVPVPEAMEAVTGFAAPGTRSPAASRNSTVGAGLKTSPLDADPGVEVTASWLAV